MKPYIRVRKPIMIAGGRYWPVAQCYPAVGVWTVIHNWMALTWAKKIDGQRYQWN